MNETKTNSKLTFYSRIGMIAFAGSNLSFLPFFVETGRTHLLSYSSWLIFILAILLSKSFKAKESAFRFLIMVATFFLLISVSTVFSPNDYFGSELVKVLAISVFVFFLGHLSGVSGILHGNEFRLIDTYILSTILVNIVVAQKYLLGQDLMSSYYAYTSKNELAFLNVAALVMLLFYKSTFLKLQKWRTAVIFASTAFLVVCTALMRCRSMLVCAFLLFGYSLFKSQTPKKLKHLLILLTVLFACLLLFNSNFYSLFMNGILFAGRNNTDFDSISSGRTIDVARGLSSFSENVFFGTGNTETVDCFFVSAMMQFGLLPGLLIIFLGFYPMIWGRKNRENGNSLYTVMLLCNFVFLFGGLMEEQAPFGTGVRCYILWFLFGYLQGMHGLYESAEIDV